MRGYDPDSRPEGRGDKAQRNRYYATLVAGPSLVLLLILIALRGTPEHPLLWLWEPAGFGDALRCLTALALLLSGGMWLYYHIEVTRDAGMVRMDEEGGTELPPGCLMFAAFGLAGLLLLRWLGVLFFALFG